MADIHGHAAKKLTVRHAMRYSGFRYSGLMLPTIVDNFTEKTAAGFQFWQLNCSLSK